MRVSIAVITKLANTGVHWSSTDLASCELQENLIGFKRAPVRHAISHFSPFHQEIQRLLKNKVHAGYPTSSGKQIYISTAVICVVL